MSYCKEEFHETLKRLVVPQTYTGDQALVRIANSLEVIVSIGIGYIAGVEDDKKLLDLWKKYLERI